MTKLEVQSPRKGSQLPGQRRNSSISSMYTNIQEQRVSFKRHEMYLLTPDYDQTVEMDKSLPMHREDDWLKFVTRFNLKFKLTRSKNVINEWSLFKPSKVKFQSLETSFSELLLRCGSWGVRYPWQSPRTSFTFRKQDHQVLT